MGIELYRIDDRLIHGQVVVGWGKPMGAGFIVLVDDEVASSAWEQELYRMGVPPEMEVFFVSVTDAVAHLDAWRRDQRPGILLTGDVDTMRRLVEGADGIRAVNLGGLHHRTGRTERIRYVYLTGEEERSLRELEARGIAVTAQDVPSARPLPLRDLLNGRPAS